MGADRLVLDLARCSSIDAAAIVYLLNLHREMVCADTTLTLRAPVPRVRRMLHLGRMDHVFSIETAEDGTP
jgi:anti-anti-sigma factor